MSAKIIRFLNPTYLTARVYLGTAVTIQPHPEVNSDVLEMKLVPLYETEPNPKTGIPEYKPIWDVKEYHSIISQEPIGNFLEKAPLNITIDRINMITLEQAAKRGMEVLATDEVTAIKGKVYSKKVS